MHGSVTPGPASEHKASPAPGPGPITCSCSGKGSNPVSRQAGPNASTPNCSSRFPIGKHHIRRSNLPHCWPTHGEGWHGSGSSFSSSRLTFNCAFRMTVFELQPQIEPVFALRCELEDVFPLGGIIWSLLPGSLFTFVLSRFATRSSRHTRSQICACRLLSLLLCERAFCANSSDTLVGLCNIEAAGTPRRHALILSSPPFTSSRPASSCGSDAFASKIRGYFESQNPAGKRLGPAVRRADALSVPTSRFGRGE